MFYQVIATNFYHIVQEFENLEHSFEMEEN